MNSKWRVWRRSSYRVLPASRSAVTLSRSAWRSSNSACRRRNSCRTDMLGFDLSTRSARHMGRAMGSVSREPRIRGRRDGRADAPSRLATSAFRMLTSSSSSSSSLKISSSWLADRGFGAGAGTFAPASGSSIPCRRPAADPRRPPWATLHRRPRCKGSKDSNGSRASAGGRCGGSRGRRPALTPHTAARALHAGRSSARAGSANPSASWHCRRSSA
jgi:hypothetical protein